MQVGDPFATLFKLPKQRNKPTAYALGVLTASAPPSADDRVGGFGGHVVKGRLMEMAHGGDDSPIEWKARRLHTSTYVCPLKLTMELNPDMTDDLTYAFDKEGLSAVHELLVSTIDDVKGWGAVPVLVNTRPSMTPPLPLHVDLVHASVEAGASEGVSTSYIDGKAECMLCSLELPANKMRLHVGGHILTKGNEV